MKLVLLYASLLLGAQAPVQNTFWLQHLWMLEPALECDTIDDLREIVIAAQRGGIYASNEHFKRINAGAREAGRQPCKRILLNPLLQMKAVEGYELVENLPNLLSDVVILEVIGQDGKTRYDAIRRFVAIGQAL